MYSEKEKAKYNYNKKIINETIEKYKNINIINEPFEKYNDK